MSKSNITKDTANEIAFEILEDLLKQHFFGKELEWSYIEGTSLLHIDPKLYSKIVSLFDYIVKDK